MWYRIISYLKFLLRSTNQHRVHSPFVFDLVTKCFYDKAKYEDYKKLEDFRNSLLNDDSSIEVNDLGAGSQVMKTSKRKINSIAKNSGTTLRRSKLLFRFANYFKPTNILELGTSLGIGTQALSLGSPHANITTIEGCENISGFTKERFSSLSLENVEQLTGDFSAFLPELSKNSYDLIFFDGNHQKKATLNYFEKLLNTIHNDSVFIFDDIYWSKGMTEAWETIKQHPKVTVTIDTYFWGFAFFREEQQKEHFTIRV
ncbi:class I SAM-dependent methyltransferase [Flavobacteriaceae sp. LMIT009]